MEKHSFKIPEPRLNPRLKEIYVNSSNKKLYLKSGHKVHNRICPRCKLFVMYGEPSHSSRSATYHLKCWEGMFI